MMKKQKKEMEVSVTTELPNLPDEIKDEIFLSLPVMTLFKFRCVIRDYCRFHNPNFIKMHLNRQIEKDNGSTIIIATASKIYKVNVDTFCSPIRLDFPFRHPTCTRPIVVVGSCNGLLCLTHQKYYGQIVYLWNPATGDYKQLPTHNNDIDPHTNLGLGFGYDHNSGKFKVLAISRREEKGAGVCKIEAFVYTLGTSSWRSIGEIQYPLRLKPHVFGGCPHWIEHRLNSIVSFSVGDEKFKEIPVPFFDNAEAKLVNLTAMGGRLSVFCHVLEKKQYELWVRVDDGLENTWTKQLSLFESEIPSYMYQYYEGIKLYGFKNGQVLQKKDGPALFDPATKCVRTLYLPGKPRLFQVYPYIESLAMVAFEDTGDVHQNS